jgi:hypothetical protein
MNRAHSFTIEIPQMLRLTNDAEIVFSLKGLALRHSSASYRATQG